MEKCSAETHTHQKFPFTFPFGLNLSTACKVYATHQKNETSFFLSSHFKMLPERIREEKHDIHCCSGIISAGDFGRHQLVPYSIPKLVKYSQMLNAWYIYLHLPQNYPNVGNRPYIEHLGYVSLFP